MSAPDEPIDEGWDEGPADGTSGDDGGDDGPDEAAAGDAGGASAGDAPRKRRRRRRRRREGADPAQPQLHGQPPHVQAQEPQAREAQRQSQPQRQPQQQRPPQPQRPQQQRHHQPPSHDRDQKARDQRGGDERRDTGRDGNQRDNNRRQRGRGRDPRESLRAVNVDGAPELRADDILRGDPYATRADGSEINRTRGLPPTIAPRPSTPTIDPRASHPTLEDDEAASDAPAVAWGTEDDSPAPTITLAPDLPVETPSADPDPLTFPLVDGPGAQLGDDVASVVGVRFVPAGRVQWCDAGDSDFTPGERVLVDSDRGQRLAWIATAPTRRPVRDRNLRRVIRRANDNDLRGEREGESDRARALRIAKDSAAALKLPLKVFRIEKAGGKLNVYYTSDERLDLRDFVREVGQATGMRLELRQLGVRDEAKVVGGIGSCGLTLCCSTWLPEFVPVSIKMAKDQGLVLSPTKVSGQCGRLKCCLVYEQAGYAELRKGLPKLGKRVISPRGEGRVVEVDVLRQRVRVSYGHGDTEVLPATDVKPMFPSGNQPREPEPDHDDHEPDPGLPNS